MVPDTASGSSMTAAQSVSREELNLCASAFATQPCEPSGSTGLTEVMVDSMLR